MEKNNGVRFILTLIFIGIVSLFIYCIRAMWWTPTSGFFDTITLFGVTLLIGGSSIAIGCLIGFVFGIPRLVADSTSSINTTNKYVGNDNLVQISDWLTKIIVGVGLTNLTQIPNYLQSLGAYLGGAIGGTRNGEVAAISIVLYFLICGFLLSYLWTRLTFAKMLENSETLTNTKL